METNKGHFSQHYMEITFGVLFACESHPFHSDNLAKAPFSIVLARKETQTVHFYGEF